MIRFYSLKRCDLRLSRATRSLQTSLGFSAGGLVDDAAQVTLHQVFKLLEAFLAIADLLPLTPGRSTSQAEGDEMLTVYCGTCCMRAIACIG